MRRISTGRGDDGTTSLIGGGRVSKGHPRIECCGAVDELSAHTGWAKSILTSGRCGLPEEELQGIRILLESIQEDLFSITSRLAAPEENPGRGYFENGPARIQFLEKAMEQFSLGLPPMRGFILPGCSEADGVLHICRTVCRRAERCIVRLGMEEAVPEAVRIYINRLSDFFFILGRHSARLCGQEEKLWNGGK